MKGAYEIKIRTKRVRYEFEIKRNITIIQGDSATGKTSLVNLIESYYNEGANSGVKLECQKECRVLRGRNWEHELNSISNSIVFIDEGNKFIRSRDFARAVRGSDNYYVIITRESLSNLPYSVDEIYGIKQNGKKIENEPVYNTMYRLYGYKNLNGTVKPKKIIMEDSNAGFDFFHTICNGKIECESAAGKSKIVNCIQDGVGGDVLIIVDGAAFGPEMNEVMQYIKLYPNYILYAPESFEWLLLKSGVIKISNIENILENTCEYVESKDFFSWERFFTDMLEQVTANSNVVPKYNKKSKIDAYYTKEGNANKILCQIRNMEIKGH